MSPFHGSGIWKSWTLTQFCDWYKELHGGAIPDTVENLKEAADGENYEWTDMYEEFAKTE